MLSFLAAIGICFYSIQSPQFPCDNAIRLIEVTNVRKISILWGTFGKNNKCLKRMLPYLHRVYIHPTNETCRRKSCHAGEVLKSLNQRQYNELVSNNWRKVKPHLRKRTREISKFTEKYPHIEWLYSTGLEDNFSKTTYVRIYKYYKRRFKNAKAIVRNPMVADYFRDTTELHGPRNYCQGRDCVYSNDGVGVKEIDTDYRGSTISGNELRKELWASRSYVWWGKIQGLTGNWIRPRNRRFRLTRSDIGLLRKMIND